MKVQEQLEVLARSTSSFDEKLKETGQYPIRTAVVDILQLNVGRKCNLACKHCHVEAGPDREELMPREIFEKCLEILESSTISTLDITGGAPEMNPHLEWFITEASRLGKRLIVRSNLVILKDSEYGKFIDIFSRHNVEICASLPHYARGQADRQRGCGTFDRAVEVIKELNERGYGAEGTGLILDLVHNPVGAFLPGNQKTLEHEYKSRLLETFGIRFNNLFCITNMPLGRYLDYLLKSDNYDDYMMELANAFNSCAADNVMCKNTLSVAWDGILYNCDFNQMLCLPAAIFKKGTEKGETDGLDNIMNFTPADFEGQEIAIHNHCFGCTAGSGSSCQGATEG